MAKEPAAAAVAAAEDTVVRKQHRREAAEPSVVHPKGLRIVATDYSDTAFAADHIAAVLKLVEKPANSGNSAQVVAVLVLVLMLVLVTRTDSSFQLVAQRLLIVVGTLSVVEAQWLTSAVVRPAPPMDPMSSSPVAVSSRLKYQ